MLRLASFTWRFYKLSFPRRPHLPFQPRQSVSTPRIGIQYCHDSGPRFRRRGEPRPSRNQRHRPPRPKHLSSSTVGPRLAPDPRVSTSACHTFAESKRRIPRRPVIKRTRPAPHLFRRLILNRNVGSPSFQARPAMVTTCADPVTFQTRAGRGIITSLSCSLASCGIVVAKIRPNWGRGSGHRAHRCRRERAIENAWWWRGLGRSAVTARSVFPGPAP
jgi:hypothetical protein